MADSPEDKSFAADQAGLSQYVLKTFSPEDALLSDVRKRAKDAGLPPIHVSRYDGRILEVIARAAGAKKIVEIGTLAGFSGLCLARALPEGDPHAVLHTFEFEPKHAAVAAETFRLGGVSHKVKIHVGAAADNLPSIQHEGPFDLVFIDADKEGYPHYLKWAAANLRVGGTVLVDNAFAWGLTTKSENDPALADPKDRAAWRAITSVNATLADPAGPFRSAMLPTGEGLAMGVKK